MQIEHPIGYVKSNIETSDLQYSIFSCDYYVKGSAYTGQQFCSLFKIDPLTGKSSSILAFRVFFIRILFVAI